MMTYSRSRRPKQEQSKPDSCNLTPRQIQILCLIYSYRGNSGCSPTLQELASHLQLSKVTVFEHVEALVVKGLLRRQANKTRSLILNKSALKLISALSEGTDDTTDFGRKEGLSSAGSFPLVGDIAAGIPLEANEDCDELDLTTLFETGEETFALRVRGESMINEQIRDGDYVLVKKTGRARDGQIVVALLPNGEATLKKIYMEPSGYRLEGANSDFKPIHIKELNIQGVVIGVIRHY
ncbi:MAG: repressor LexA [Sedimentisphaerales bacterium]|nr:repressor LexA [Sedimentisphaerales bacterium]